MYLAITFHYNDLKGLFDSFIVVVVIVVVGARSRLAFFRNRGWLLALFSLFLIKYFDMNIPYLSNFFHVKYINNLFKVVSKSSLHHCHISHAPLSFLPCTTVVSPLHHCRFSLARLSCLPCTTVVSPLHHCCVSLAPLSCLPCTTVVSPMHHCPSLIAWHTGRMKLLSWQSWSFEIKDVGRFTSRICNTGRMKLKFQVFVKLVSCQSKRTTQCAPVRNKIIILIYNYWTLITVVHSYLNSLQYTKEQQ